MDFKNGTAVFIIPFFGVNELSIRFLDETLRGIYAQTDKNFRIVLIDDFSPYQGSRAHLDKLQAKYQKTIYIIFNRTNEGPGACRNTGVRWAHEQNYPIVLFNDADDLSHCRRLEVVRKIFVEDPGTSVVYSTVKVIDENGKLVSRDKLAPSILEILEGHDVDPVEGDNAWIRIGVEKGYTNFTSATSVHTVLAFQYPFPPLRISEDSHTWMRYSAGGGKFYYSPEIPSLYRIPQNSDGSSSRSRAGGRHFFNIQKIETDTAGFLESMEIAVRKFKIKSEEKDDLLARFYTKLGETMAKENELQLAKELTEQAMAISRKRAIEPERFRVCETGVKELKLHLQKEVTTYLTYSLPLCAILWNERQFGWFYNHFLPLYSLLSDNGYFWMDYMEDRDFYKDIADYTILDCENLKDEPNIIRYLEDKINLGYYVIIFLDEFHLPGKYCYQQTHQMQQLMVYGYDKVQQKFNTVTFDDKYNFAKMMYHYENLKDAYEKGRSYYDISEPWVKQENVELIKPELTSEISFNMNSFCADLNDYLSGNGDFLKIRPMNLMVFGNKASYNINVYDEFIQDLTLSGGEFRYMYLMAEHKKIMFQRLTYIENMPGLNANVVNLTEEYHRLARKFTLARNLYLKQLILREQYQDLEGSQKIIEKIIEILKRGKDEEYLILNKVNSQLS